MKKILIKFSEDPISYISNYNNTNLIINELIEVNKKIYINLDLHKQQLFDKNIDIFNFSKNKIINKEKIILTEIFNPKENQKKTIKKIEKLYSLLLSNIILLHYGNIINKSELSRLANIITKFFFQLFGLPEIDLFSIIDTEISPSLKKKLNIIDYIQSELTNYGIKLNLRKNLRNEVALFLNSPDLPIITDLTPVAVAAPVAAPVAPPVMSSISYTIGGVTRTLNIGSKIAGSAVGASSEVYKFNDNGTDVCLRISKKPFASAKEKIDIFIDNLKHLVMYILNKKYAREKIILDIYYIGVIKDASGAISKIGAIMMLGDKTLKQYIKDTIGVTRNILVEIKLRRKLIYKVFRGLEIICNSIPELDFRHGDLKEINIMMVGDKPKLIDFGFSIIIINDGMNTLNLEIIAPVKVLPPPIYKNRNVNITHDILQLIASMSYFSTYTYKPPVSLVAAGGSTIALIDNIDYHYLDVFNTMGNNIFNKDKFNIYLARKKIGKDKQMKVINSNDRVPNIWKYTYSSGSVEFINSRNHDSSYNLITIPIALASMPSRLYKMMDYFYSNGVSIDYETTRGYRATAAGSQNNVIVSLEKDKANGLIDPDIDLTITSGDLLIQLGLSGEVDIDDTKTFDYFSKKYIKIGGASNEINYNNKYLKYKNKYLNLRNNIN